MNGRVKRNVTIFDARLFVRNDCFEQIRLYVTEVLKNNMNVCVRDWKPTVCDGENKDERLRTNVQNMLSVLRSKNNQLRARNKSVFE